MSGGISSTAAKISIKLQFIWKMFLFRYAIFRSVCNERAPRWCYALEQIMFARTQRQRYDE